GRGERRRGHGGVGPGQRGPGIRGAGARRRSALARGRDRRVSTVVTPEAILDAAERIRGVVVRTPLLPADWLAEEIGAEVRLKCENLQRGGAFKLRGAYTMISRLPEALRRAGVITYSSGNHAQAVALAARRFGIPAVV